MNESKKRLHSPDRHESEAKLTKTVDKPSNGTGLPSDEKHLFAGFVVDKILAENSQRKAAFIQGHYEGRDETAVVILEKTPFSAEKIKAILGKESETTADLKNDIYHTLNLIPSRVFSGIKTTLIYPATQKHVEKYQYQEQHLIHETPDDYKNITEPYITSDPFSIQWVYNILEKKQEAERIVFEDPDKEIGFVLLPDMKWDCKQLEDLYLIAIVHKHHIKSLRDLNESHLPLLRNILNKGTEAIKEKFSVPVSQLRIYLHYQPSSYHLHVHFTHLSFDAPGSSVERGHLLTDVIDNIQMCGNYYVKKTLSFVTKEGDKLYSLFKAKGKV